MIKSKKGILIALTIPIVSLLLLVAYKKYVLSIGEEVILSISGYDPRDLLSGHYLIYRINYGVKGVCGNTSSKLKKTGYVCLKPKTFSYRWPDYCESMIKGICNRGRFEAGIERFYVPEEKARKLEDLLRSNKASIVLSVLKNGKAQIKDLLIDSTSWREIQ